MVDGNGTALARVEPEQVGLVMVTSPAEALKRLQQLQAFVKEVMVKDQDYGVIPGTEKPTLLKPGAEKLCEIYGFAASFQTVDNIQDWDKPLFHYEIRCTLTSRKDGHFIGDGLGSCNSKEKRYAGRWVFDNEVPPGLAKASLTRRERKSKKPPFRPYTQFFVPNDDIFTLVNTIKKMGCKRALVAAVIGATRSAGIFTQDLEDLPEEAFGKAEEPAKVTITSTGEPVEARQAPLEEKLQESIDATSPEAQAAAEDVQAGEDAATDDELDARYGDPDVRVQPRTCKETVKGKRMSECSPQALGVLAHLFDWMAEQSDSKGEMAGNGKPKSEYQRKDARLARGWRRRLAANA